MTLWLGLFLVGPLVMVALYSLLQRGPYGEIVWHFNLANYQRALDPLYLRVYAKSLVLAGSTTGICAVLGLPLAYTIATSSKRWQPTLLGLLMLPFLTNFVVRVYAIRLILAAEGPINLLLLGSGLTTEPWLMTDSAFAVALGMVTNYLPFMVLPIYVVFEKFDFTIIDAAKDLGARGWPIFRRIILPLARPGLISGVSLVFVPVLGEYTIPDLLGGAKTLMLGGLITEQFLRVRDWPFGAALAMILVLSMVSVMGLMRLVGDPATRRQRGFIPG
ncbi:MAG: ABC transporter permease [Deltaproteobacteria bacterium]|nr:ABC transporter permease [Deltaproteobacteria bacterium]